MRRKRRSPFEGFNLSFLDVISCGFGAIVLLLVLTKIGEPQALETAREDLDALIAQLQEEIFEIRGETDVFTRQLVSREEQLSEEREMVARLRGDLSELRGEFAATDELSEVNEIIEGRLLAAQQTLTEEMKRLQSQAKRRQVDRTLVGGIPVDSEYVIFVIDTSGSMFTYAWPTVIQKMTQVLDIYPKVKGILERLRTWNVFSNSSPVEGITRANRANRSTW
jgi:hypothetical protein